MKPLPTYIALFAAFIIPAFAQVTFPSLNSSPWLGQELLSKVESSSVNINIALDTDSQVYAEYGTASGAYSQRSATQAVIAGAPLNIALTGLAPNTRYYYRINYAVAPSTSFTARPERSFTTQRPRGSSFTFAIQADPHLDNNSSSDVYKLTLANILADRPDFLIDLGDSMLTDKLDKDGVPVNGAASPTAAGVLTRTRLHRSYYDQAGHSVPLFFAMGNHEAEWGSNLNGSLNNVALWDLTYRSQYLPNPAPDEFFSGDSQAWDINGNPCTAAQGTSCAIGLRRSYYSWEWGDALFVVLDPFWSQTAGATTTQAGSGQSCCRRGAGYWSLTLGSAQYNWLRQTLEKSTSKYKFVFSHNLVGGVQRTVNGVDQGPMRGGIEAASFLEWGGNNLDGTWGLTTYRPEMPLSIHQILVANRVTAYFHGHDHLYANQTLDGVIYQEVPQPSATNSNLGTRGSDYGYSKGTILGGRGYIRVQVTDTGVKADYVETWLPAEVRANITNGMVAHTWNATPSATAAAPSISGVSNAATGASGIAPNTWVAVTGSNLAPPGVARSWQTADFTGGNVPTQLDGVSVTVNGTPAYVSYISGGQVNILIPTGIAGGDAQVLVTANGLTSQAFATQAAALSPSFFVFTGGTHIAATHADGKLIGPTTLYPGLSTPAVPGETIVLYGNGFGPVSVPLTPGSPSQSGSLSPLPEIRIGGVAATVQFAGLISPGLYQFNVVVPANTPAGDQSIIATQGGQTTQAGGLIAVRTATTTSSFVLTSAAGKEGGALPSDYTCDGAGSTNQLSWSGAPTGTKEFAVLMTTLPGDGTTKWNWVVYRLPATTTSLNRDSFLVGTLGVGSDGPGMVYNPPCSQGPGAKQYTWTVYALSASPVITVPANQVNGQVLADAIRNLTLGTATLNLTYSRASTAPGSSQGCGYIASSLRASKSGTATIGCDATYAYISSSGITTQPMMNGITSTNLQVPIPQNFLGANAWKIPLRPALAATPTSVVDGPLGVAINGVPIFNPCTQGGCVTGGDTKALGQLDTCNGHAGRADDYHYHAAPTCMMADQPPAYWDTHPLGWALDGFAIFGFNDADGSVAVRDNVCGGNTKTVPNAPAGYSYHVTNASPYVTNCLAGTPSPDLAGQGAKYRPMRQPPVTPFNVSGMTMTTDSDGYQVLQFTSRIAFTSTENGTDKYANPPDTYRIRYKQVIGDALVTILGQQRNNNATACWTFQFLNSAGSTSQPEVSYCR